MNLRQIGERIRERRKEKGMTIGEFAQALHIMPRSAALIESGQANIDLQCLIDMCACLDRTPNQLLADNYIASDQSKLEDAMALAGLAPEPGPQEPRPNETTVINDNLATRRKIQAMLSSYREENNPYKKRR